MVPESKINQFIEKISMGVAFFEEAGRLLVEMIDHDASVREKILKSKRADWLTQDVLDTFEAIGRKQIAVQAIFLPKHVLNRVGALPISDQVKISTELVPVVTGLRRGKAVVDKKPAAKLTRKEAVRAISPFGVRPVAEQKQMVITQAPGRRLLGAFNVSVVDGKPILKPASETSGEGVKVVLNCHGTALLEIYVPLTSAKADLKDQMRENLQRLYDARATKEAQQEELLEDNPLRGIIEGQIGLLNNKIKRLEEALA